MNNTPSLPAPAAAVALKNMELNVAFPGSATFKITLAVNKSKLEGLQSIASKQKPMIELHTIKEEVEQIEKLAQARIEKFLALVEGPLTDAFGKSVPEVSVESKLLLGSGQIKITFNK